jgi:hypothetical protein
MVLKYLVAFLALASGAPLGSDPKTWTPKLTCDQCMSVVNRTETALSYNACRGLPREETTLCKDIVSLAVERFSPDVVCQELGYCPKKVWFWLSF